MSLLSVCNLAIDFVTPSALIHAVRGVSFDIAAGERVGLVGESGSGKTTTALALMRMIKSPGRITGGSANLDGIDLLALSRAEIRLARLAQISYVPQGAMSSLNPVLRVREQILDGVADHGGKLTRKQRDSLVVEALDGVGLAPGVADLYPHELSGGMRQRVCIAIAIVLKPKLIIADEPTSALDVISQRQVMDTLQLAQERVGCGMILIGHDMGLMAQSTHRVIVMQDGYIVEDSDVRAIFHKPSHPYSKMLIESVPTLGNRLASPAIVVAERETVPLLRFDEVSKTYGSKIGLSQRKPALHRCSFTLNGERPQIVAVVGQSGSGKSTMARMVLGLERATTGRVLYKGNDITTINGAGRRAYRTEVQAIFQDPYGTFNPFYKIDHTLSEPLIRFGIATERRAIYGRIEDACTQVGLNASEVLGRFPHELSGGQRQRLMVARAMMLRPRLIVADEPVSMVDASLRMTILRNIEALKDQQNISVIYITHDLATAYQVSDFILVLHEGRIVEAGTPTEVIDSPEHGYTRALVGAIPWPDPEHKWGELGDLDAEGWRRQPAALRSRAPGFDLAVA